jgi:hypothetical protein
MRIYRHDFRDMTLAFGLSFDVKRITQAGVALSWTLIILLGVVAVLSWRAGGLFSPEGILGAWEAQAETPWTPLKMLLWGSVVCAWWAGFGYLCAPVQRSAALDIARDEREREINIPPLNRQAAFSPLLMMLLPALAVVLLLLWSLLTYIPGMAGGVISAVTLPLVLLAATAGAAFLLVGALAAPMMGPTAVIEGRDYLEAISRPMSYVMQRPGRYFAYWAAKLGVLAASGLAGGTVLAIAWGLVALALWLVGQGELVTSALSEVTASGTASFKASPAAFGIAVVFWSSTFVVTSWLMVVALSADTLIYMLMRYRVDGVTFDKIVVVEEKPVPPKTATETAAEAEEARKRFDEAAANASAAAP